MHGFDEVHRTAHEGIGARRHGTLQQLQCQAGVSSLPGLPCSPGGCAVALFIGPFNLWIRKGVEVMLDHRQKTLELGFQSTAGIA
jgi:hypothetical protein